ncbi:hypothetical protein [Paenibacillus sp. N3.4]|uniref:hypothetical protein n=1 Tax=Paenibacillus sp. N3.4 TaxID=2603222 RepID=UPI0011CC7D3A|nr:hypothetical protein [Paenibacillus sp. N3.4]TXK80676.1 hypothetical protein FU659_17805 [Paenibacillus sp. N3.4]
MFEVFLSSPIQYKVHEKHVGFFKYLGERNGLIIAKFSSTGSPYDNLKPLQKQDYDLFFNLYKDIKLVLDSFKLTEKWDINLFNEVIEESKGKDDEYKEEYERLIKEETNQEHETK